MATLSFKEGRIVGTPQSPLAKEIMTASRQTISLRIARLLALLIVFFVLPAGQAAVSNQRWSILFSFIVGIALIWYAALSTRQGHQLRTISIIIGLFLVMAGETATHGLFTDGMPYAILTVILATVLLNVWFGLGTLVTSITLVALAGSLTHGGALDLSSTYLQGYFSGQLWLWVAVKFIVFVPVAVYPFLWLLADTQRSLSQQRDLTQALTQEQQILARRIATRRRALETSLEISANLSTLLDVELLANEVVEQVGRSFNYYHVQIYLLNQAKNHLELIGATGDAGIELLTRGHSVAIGEGMVGRAAKEREFLLAPDVQIDPHWVPNELLPDTRSEIVVPIVAADELIGVLDVQHNLVEGLTADDLIVLQTISNQVAIAVQNAKLFNAAQRRAETVAMVNRVALNIRKETELDGVLQAAISEIGERVNAQESFIKISIDKDELV